MSVISLTSMGNVEFPALGSINGYMQGKSINPIKNEKKRAILFTLFWLALSCYLIKT